MVLSRRDRFRLKSELLSILLDDDWSYDRTNLLLGEFGLAPLDGGPWGEVLSDRLAGISDDDLVDLYSIASGVDVREVADIVDSDETRGNWKTGYVRLFLTHSAEHKTFVSEVSRELAVVGVDGFVAHDAMEIAAPWQEQIELALQTMDAFAAIVHPKFGARPWCQQEIGWAFGRRVPRFAVRMGEDPTAFLGSDQWPSGVDRSAKEVAEMIAGWICGLPELGEKVLSGLLVALESSRNYFDAEAAAKRIAALGSLPSEAFDRINKIWWSNDQLYGGFLPTRVMERFYAENGRSWPPSKPASTSP